MYRQLRHDKAISSLSANLRHRDRGFSHRGFCCWMDTVGRILWEVFGCPWLDRGEDFNYLDTKERIYIYIYVCVRFSFKENWRSGQVIVHIDKVNALALHPFARFIRYLDLILVTRINATCQHLKYILTDVLLRHFIDIFLL